jgi:hypothetical protein
MLLDQLWHIYCQQLAVLDDDLAADDVPIHMLRSAENGGGDRVVQGAGVF